MVWPPDDGVDSADIALGSDIGFGSDIALPKRFGELKAWMINFGSIHDSQYSSYTIAGSDWSLQVAYMFLGIGHPHRAAYFFLRYEYACGMMISNLLVRPLYQPEAQIRYHLIRRKLLNIPIIDQEIQAMSLTPRLQTIETIGARSISLKANKSFESSPSLIIGAKPCWETDGRRIIFNCRLQGAPLSSIEISNLDQGRQLDVRKPCQCGRHVVCFDTSIDDSWYELTIERLLKAASRNLSQAHPRKERIKHSRYLLDASASDATTMFAFGTIEPRSELWFVWDCFACAIEAMDKRLAGAVRGVRQAKANFDQVLIIPYGHQLWRHKQGGCGSTRQLINSKWVSVRVHEYDPSLARLMGCTHVLQVLFPVISFFRLSHKLRFLSFIYCL
jgi:hypothetical protein